jgi:VIT1/CCC1 family predicted Fe2+/Mn2+ transporter
MLGPIVPVISMLWGRLQELRADDRGMTTETLIITAILAIAALAAVGAIGASIRNKGNDISNEIDGALALL